MKTIMTIAQQKQWLDTNPQYDVLTHKWSCRGYGNSKFCDSWGTVISKASGCGYDRRGKALGEVIRFLFPNELEKLANKTKKGKTGKTAFYGLQFYGDKLSIDGACGFECMTRILNAIGFSIRFLTQSESAQTGQQVYQLVPLTKNDRRYLK